MQAVDKQAVQAGAMGIGSNRVGGHSDLSGNPVPGSFAPRAEIEALASAIREAGFDKGLLSFPRPYSVHTENTHGEKNQSEE